MSGLGTAVAPLNTATIKTTDLPTNQIDFRNITGKRFIEISVFFTRSQVEQGQFTDPFRISIPATELTEAFSYNHAQMLRIVTVGLESYNIVHYLPIARPGVDDPPWPGFVEGHRYPIVLTCDTLQSLSNSRYVALLTNDAGVGLYTTSAVSTNHPFPAAYVFNIGILNLVDTADTRVYPMNADGPIDPNDVPVPPNEARPQERLWYNQWIKVFNARLFIDVKYEPYRRPVFGPSTQNSMSHRVMEQQMAAAAAPSALTRLFLQDPQNIPSAIANTILTQGGDSNSTSNPTNLGLVPILAQTGRFAEAHGVATAPLTSESAVAGNRATGAMALVADPNTVLGELRERKKRKVR